MCIRDSLVYNNTSLRQKMPPEYKEKTINYVSLLLSIVKEQMLKSVIANMDETTLIFSACSNKKSIRKEKKV